jgi:hypothetical protein
MQRQQKESDMQRQQKESDKIKQTKARRGTRDRR